MIRIRTGILLAAALLLLAVVTGCGGGKKSDAMARLEKDATARATKPAEVSRVADVPPTLTALPATTPILPPTAKPQPTAVTVSSAPIYLSGRGQFASQSITPPGSVSLVTLTHSGTSNFIVRTYAGASSETMVNEIGRYQGTRPLWGRTPVIFDINADGPWTIRIEALDVYTKTAAFGGKGDAVSRLFDPPAPGAFEITHNGSSNFIVILWCAGGRTTVQNEIGRVSGSRVVTFKDGPCLWEVKADGEWSLRPRQ